MVFLWKVRRKILRISLSLLDRPLLNQGIIWMNWFNLRVCFLCLWVWGGCCRLGNRLVNKTIIFLPSWVWEKSSKILIFFQRENGCWGFISSFYSKFHSICKRTRLDYSKSNTLTLLFISLVFEYTRKYELISDKVTFNSILIYPYPIFNLHPANGAFF